MVTVYGGGESSFTTLAEETQVPLVAPLAAATQQPSSASRYAFYLFSGLHEQALVLLDYARKELRAEMPALAIVAVEGEPFSASAAALLKRARDLGWENIARRSYAPGRVQPTSLLDQLQADGVVLFLGPSGDARRLAEEAAGRNVKLNLLIPGSLVGREIFDLPVAFDGQIFAAFPTLPNDQDPAVTAQVAALVRESGLRRGTPARLLWTYASARILVEGLRLAGRDLSREGLVAALEGLYDFETGVTPRISFGPNRRTGALGAYVVRVDREKRQFVRVSEWITPTI